MKNLSIRARQLKYLTFCAVSSVVQLLLVTIPPSLFDTYLGRNQISSAVQNVLFWLAPGRIAYKSGDNLFLFDIQNFLIIVGFNFSGLILVLSPLYFVNMLFSPRTLS